MAISKLNQINTESVWSDNWLGAFIMGIMSQYHSELSKKVKGG